MKTRRQVFVRFMSPGTFVDETSESPIERADIKTAIKMAADIRERHGARPYGFEFITRIAADSVDDGEGGKMDVRPKEVERTGAHYIDGRPLTLDDVPDKDSTLAFNMRVNRWVCCETAPPDNYRHCGLYGERDVIVSSASGEITDRGDDPRYTPFREAAR